MRVTPQERINQELGILQEMLAAETELRDKLVELGQPEGFKTTKMKYFEKQIARLQAMKGGMNGAETRESH